MLHQPQQEIIATLSDQLRSQDRLRNWPQRPLAQFRDVWARQIPCQAVAAGDSIVAIVGGAALCCDLLGQSRWLRRETWLTSAVDSRALARHRDPPLVAGDVVYVTQPSMPGVECLDLATGQLRWQYVSPKLSRLVGLVKEIASQRKVGRRKVRPEKNLSCKPAKGSWRSMPRPASRSGTTMPTRCWKLSCAAAQEACCICSVKKSPINNLVPNWSGLILPPAP